MFCVLSCAGSSPGPGQLPGTLALYTAHVSERNEKFIDALAQHAVILITALVRMLGCKSILLL